MSDLNEQLSKLEQLLNGDGLKNVWLHVWKNIKQLTGNVEWTTKGDLQTQVNRLSENVKEQDSADNTVTFKSDDIEDESATSWTSVSPLISNEKHSSVFGKVSQMFKNVRYLYKVLGTTDISKIGDGSCTGAISKLNSSITDLNDGLSNKAPSSHTHDDRYYTETEIDNLLSGNINSSNIGSQSVNYATSSYSADVLDGQHGSYYRERIQADYFGAYDYHTIYINFSGYDYIVVNVIDSNKCAIRTYVVSVDWFKYTEYGTSKILMTDMAGTTQIGELYYVSDDQINYKPYRVEGYYILVDFMR